MHDCTHARHAKDAAEVLEEHVSDAERNRFDFIPCEDGRRTAVRGIFDNVSGAAIQSAVRLFAKPSGYGDERPRSRRFADALVEIATLPSTRRGRAPGGRAHLQLTASVETVMGLEGAPGGDLEFAGAVPAATVQRLACDARVRRILLGPKSAVIDVGRAQRLPGPGARAALGNAPGSCEWPGCDRSVAFTNAHHLVHWGHGGGTELNNLVLLCYRHHWMVHEGGWQLARVRRDGCSRSHPRAPIAPGSAPRGTPPPASRPPTHTAGGTLTPSTNVSLHTHVAGGTLPPGRSPLIHATGGTLRRVTSAPASAPHPCVNLSTLKPPESELN